VAKIAFPTTLKTLEYALGFFGYYRKFVLFYSYISGPLQDLKTKAFTKAPKKGKERDKYVSTYRINPKDHEAAVAAWIDLKDKLCNTPVLAHPDFEREFILYYDASKERGYGVALHQVSKPSVDRTVDGIDESKPVERPILFLSKSLTDAEKNY